MRRLIGILLAASLALVSTIPTLAVTDWKTKATVNSQTMVLDATASLIVDVKKPATFRIRVRTPSHAQTLEVNYSVFCVTTGYDSGSKSGSFNVTTTGDSAWSLHGVPRPTGTWAECSVNVFTISGTKGTLSLQLQAKLR